MGEFFGLLSGGLLFFGFLFVFLVQPLADFFFVAFVIQLQETRQSLATRGFGDREAHSLRRFVKAVP